MSFEICTRIFVVVLTLSSQPGAVLGAEPSGFTPGCSFVGNQCMYTVQLGHQNQCDSQPASGAAENPKCCETLTNDVTLVKQELSELKSQLEQLQKIANESRTNLSTSQAAADLASSERDTLLQKLHQKEEELNTTQTDLARIISQAGHEIEGLRSALTNATKALQTCRVALGVTAPVDGIADPATSGNVHLSYCKFDTLTDCGYQTLTGSTKFTSLSRSQSTYTGPKTGHSTGTLGDHWVGLNVYGMSAYTSSSDTPRAATIESDLFQPAASYCIQFWYSMRGTDVHGLDVNVRIGGGTGYAVWSKRGDQKENWSLGQVELDSEYTENPFKIDFVATTTQYADRYRTVHNRRGDIGVDDVYVYNTTCSAVPKCQPNAVTRDGNQSSSCYTVHTEPMSWDNAFDTCRREGAESGLVSIETKEEQDFLVNLIRTDPAYNLLGDRGFYTSGNDKDTEHKFVWTSTGTARSLVYTNWHQGQPNNVGGDQDCLLLEYPQDDFAWGDVDCSDKHAFICEVEL